MPPNTTTNTLDSYDDLPYESLPLPDTHPDYLRAIARLYGVNAAPAESCRVLELGCAGGGNILPLAWYHPNCAVTGVELAQRHENEANALIAELGLNNAQVLHRSITDSMDDLGEFDYILAHGVFSWVPRAVQDRLLEICGQHRAQRHRLCELQHPARLASARPTARLDVGVLRRRARLAAFDTSV